MYSCNLFILFCLFSLLTCTITDSRFLDLKFGGILPMKSDDMAVMFYITVESNELSVAPGRMKLEMVKCCEVMPNHEYDCDTIELLPYYEDLILNHTSNYTLILPNVYPFGRLGECIVEVHYTQKGKFKKESRTQIHFNTNFDEERACETVKDFYETYDIKKCKTQDQDPLDGCKLVDCIKKYSGHRNYLDKTLKSCIAIPKCLPKSKKDVIYAYDLYENACKELQSPQISMTDISEIHMQRECSKPNMHTVLHHINCHHGVMNSENNLCDCSLGWLPADMPEDDNFRPYYLPTFHTCNVHSGYWTAWDVFQIPFPFWVTCKIVIVIRLPCQSTNEWRIFIESNFEGGLESESALNNVPHRTLVQGLLFHHNRTSIEEDDGYFTPGYSITSTDESGTEDERVATPEDVRRLLEEM